MTDATPKLLKQFAEALIPTDKGQGLGFWVLGAWGSDESTGRVPGKVDFVPWGYTPKEHAPGYSSGDFRCQVEG